MKDSRFIQKKVPAISRRREGRKRVGAPGKRDILVFYRAEGKGGRRGRSTRLLAEKRVRIFFQSDRRGKEEKGGQTSLQKKGGTKCPRRQGGERRIGPLRRFS